MTIDKCAVCAIRGYDITTNYVEVRCLHNNVIWPIYED